MPYHNYTCTVTINIYQTSYENMQVTMTIQEGYIATYTCMLIGFIVSQMKEDYAKVIQMGSSSYSCVHH